MNAKRLLSSALLLGITSGCGGDDKTTPPVVTPTPTPSPTAAPAPTPTPTPAPNPVPVTPAIKPNLLDRTEDFVSYLFKHLYIASPDTGPFTTTGSEKDGFSLEYRRLSDAYRVVRTFFYSRGDVNPYQIFDTVFTRGELVAAESDGRVETFRKTVNGNLDELKLYRAGPTNDLLNSTYCSIGQSQIRANGAIYTHQFGYGYMDQATTAPPRNLKYSGIVLGQAVSNMTARYNLTGSFTLTLTYDDAASAYRAEGSASLVGVNPANGQTINFADARLITNTTYYALTFTEAGATPSIEQKGFFRFCGPVREEIVGVVQGAVSAPGQTAPTAVSIAFVGKFA